LKRAYQRENFMPVSPPSTNSVTQGSTAYNVLRSYIGVDNTTRRTQADVDRRMSEFNVVQTTEKEGGFFGLGAKEVQRYEFTDRTGNRIVVRDDGGFRRETALFNANNQLLREQNFTNAGVTEGELVNGKMQYNVYDQRLQVQDGRRQTDDTGRTMASTRRNADGLTLVNNIGRGIGDAVRDPWTYVKAGAGVAAFTALGATALAPALPFIAGAALVSWGAHKLWQGYQATQKGGAAALTTDFARSTATETAQIAFTVGLSKPLANGGTATASGGGGRGPNVSPSPAAPPTNAQPIPRATTPTPAPAPTTPTPSTPVPQRVPAFASARLTNTGGASRVPVTARQRQITPETQPLGFEPVQKHLFPQTPSKNIPVVAGRNPRPSKIPPDLKPLSEVTLASAKPSGTSTRNVSLGPSS
jgi:hypothetical protein